MRFLQKNPALLAFALMSMLGGLSFGLARVLTSLYALELKASTAELGLIVAAQNLGLWLMALPVGLLIDALGSRRLFFWGSLFAGLAYAATPWVQTPLFLMVCVTFIGFCMPCRFVALNAAFMEQLATLGEAHAGWARGNALIGMLLVGPALAVSVIVAFGFVGAWLLVAVLVWAGILLAPLVLHQGTPATKTTLRHSISPVAILRQIRSMLDESALRETCLIDFCVQSTIAFFSFFIVPIAIQQFHFRADAAASLITAEGALFILALFFLGGLISRWGLQRVYVVSLAGASVALLVLGLAQQGAGLWIGSVLLGLSLGILQIVSLSRFARISNELGRGKVAGVISLIGPSGGLVGGFLGGVWGKYFGLQSAFLLLLIPLACFAVYMALRREIVFSS